MKVVSSRGTKWFNLFLLKPWFLHKFETNKNTNINQSSLHPTPHLSSSWVGIGRIWRPWGKVTWKKHWRSQLSHEKKPGPTFHYTGWLIGILISWFIKNSPYNWVVFHPLYQTTNQGLFHCSTKNVAKSTSTAHQNLPFASYWIGVWFMQKRALTKVFFLYRSIHEGLIFNG